MHLTSLSISLFVSLIFVLLSVLWMYAGFEMIEGGSCSAWMCLLVGYCLALSYPRRCWRLRLHSFLPCCHVVYLIVRGYCCLWLLSFMRFALILRLEIASSQGLNLNK